MTLVLQVKLVRRAATRAALRVMGALVRRVDPATPAIERAASRSPAKQARPRRLACTPSDGGRTPYQPPPSYSEAVKAGVDQERGEETAVSIPSSMSATSTPGPTTKAHRRYR